jgi:two-component system, sporulation sensor kinase E
MSDFKSRILIKLIMVGLAMTMFVAITARPALSQFADDNGTSFQAAEEIGKLGTSEIIGICLVLMSLTLIAFVIYTLVSLYLSEDKFSKAFRNNPDPISITTLKEGRHVNVNEAFLQCFGYERNELMGRSLSEIGICFVPEEEEFMLEEIHKQGSIHSFETDLRTKSGEIRNFLISADILEMGRKRFLLYVSQDITARKQMEEALRISEQRFSTAFNSSPMMITISTLEDERFLDVNKSFCRTVDYSREELLGHKASELGIWTNKSDRHQVQQGLLDNDTLAEKELYFYTKNRDQRLALYSAEIIEINGEACVLSILTDITERKEMEIEMIRLDRLGLVGEMAASIGHEIRNPMTTVRGFLQIMSEKPEYQNDGEYFDLMIEELDRANSIITEFLSLAKNKMVDLKLVNLQTLLINMLPLVRANAVIHDQDIKLEMEDVPDLLLDEKEIRQMVLNLVHNGLESMPADRCVTIKTLVDNDKVVLAIQDQGHGIDADLLEKMGTPFFTTKEHGTGLGLAVCYGIAARHHARIDIETGSTGTTFYVRFPFHEDSGSIEIN